MFYLHVFNSGFMAETKHCKIQIELEWKTVQCHTWFYLPCFDKSHLLFTFKKMVFCQVLSFIMLFQNFPLLHFSDSVAPENSLAMLETEND